MNDKVKITVHRGSHQIGGCCTEIEYKSSRIIIDMGSPLSDDRQEVLKIDGVTKGIARCDGLLLTHYHGDHIGEVPRVLQDINIYSSRITKEFIKAYKEHMGRHYICNIDTDRIIAMEDGEQIVIGEFIVKAIRVDHSAAGAFMYYITAGEKHILFTGDFRLHGKRRNKIFKTINKLGRVDLLITEGTTLSRNESEKWDEQCIKEKMKETSDKYKYCFVLTSSSNIDRIQSIADSVVTGKYFLMDRFQRKILSLAEKYDDYIFRKKTYYEENIKKSVEVKGFIMLIRESCADLYKEYVKKYPNETCLVYSMWSGYLKYDNIKRLYDISLNKRIIHSSGHVLLQDLNEFIDIIQPDKIAVIHTDKMEIDNLNERERIIVIKDKEAFFI